MGPDCFLKLTENYRYLVFKSSYLPMSKLFCWFPGQFPVYFLVLPLKILHVTDKTQKYLWFQIIVRQKNKNTHIRHYLRTKMAWANWIHFPKKRRFLFSSLLTKKGSPVQKMAKASRKLECGATTVTRNKHYLGNIYSNSVEVTLSLPNLSNKYERDSRLS